MKTGASWPESVRVDFETMAEFAQEISVLDPRSKKDIKTSYGGVALPKLIELAGLEKGQGVTVIGADQYVGYLPGEKLAGGFLVWEMNQAPISLIKGGPLRVIFEQPGQVHRACNTWYAEVLVSDSLSGAQLFVEVAGRGRTFELEELLQNASPLDPALVSLAQGCRNELKGTLPLDNVRAVPLDWFLQTDKNRRKQNISLIRFIPLAGPEISLGPEALNSPVSVIVGCGTSQIHPALGGPFAVIFPVESHPQLAEKVPESGALFFLKKIIVR